MKTKRGKKTAQSDKLYDKKFKKPQKKTNPFEVHINKEKFDVLNRPTVHSRGLPLVSRSRAIETRKQTLGVEYNLQHKSNIFQDRRKEQRAGPKPLKESIYNLNDSEVLTHKGQTLAEIERFDDVRDDEDNLSDTELRLDANFTEAAHFGGGEEHTRDRKTVIDELIADSKKRKLERLRENEELMEMTDKLDSDWKDLIPVVGKLHKQEEEQTDQDDYDRLVKEMIFAPRGEPTEKLKTEEDQALIEKNRLEKLESDRLARMRGEIDEEGKRNHRSADDLDDGYFLEAVTEENEEDNKVISYEIDPEKAAAEKEAVNGDAEEEEAGDEDEGEEEEEEESGEESEEDDLEDLKESEDEEASEVEEDVEEASDAGELEEEEEEVPVKKSKVLKIAEEEKPSPKIQEKPAKPAKEVFSVEENQALARIPFTIAMPESYEELTELLEPHPPGIQSIIIDRIIKTNHPRLLQVNRNKMIALFTYLLQYINDLFSSNTEDNISTNFHIVDELTPVMFDLIQLNADEASKCFLEVIKEKYADFKKNTRQYPQLDTLIYFQIMGKLFPTSDYRHPVLTPANVFIHQILSQCRVKSRADVSSGLFLTTLVLEHQQLSKKFLPSVLNFLHGVCYLGIKKSPIDGMKAIPPFKRFPKLDSILVLSEDYEGKCNDKKMRLKSSDFLDNEIDESFKMRAVNLSVNLMLEFIQLYEDQNGIKYFITPFENILNRVKDQDHLSSQFNTRITKVLAELERLNQEKVFVFMDQGKEKTRMLRMLEPKIETVYSDRRALYTTVSDEKAEQLKLKHMVKREFKSAKREIRRDNEFISKIRHKRRMEGDRERKDKVKKIFSEASVQQSEYNALQRTKGRRNKL